MQEGSGAHYCHSMRGVAGEFPLGGPFIGVPAAVLNLNFNSVELLLLENI